MDCVDFSREKDIDFSWQIPVLINRVSPLMKRKWFNLVLMNLAGFWLNSWSYICLKCPILPFNRSNLKKSK